MKKSELDAVVAAILAVGAATSGKQPDVVADAYRTILAILSGDKAKPTPQMARRSKGGVFTDQ